MMIEFSQKLEQALKTRRELEEINEQKVKRSKSSVKSYKERVKELLQGVSRQEEMEMRRLGTWDIRNQQINSKLIRLYYLNLQQKD